MFYFTDGNGTLQTEILSDNAVKENICQKTSAKTDILSILATGRHFRPPPHLQWFIDDTPIANVGFAYDINVTSIVTRQNDNLYGTTESLLRGYLTEVLCDPSKTITIVATGPDGQTWQQHNVYYKSPKNGR